MMKSVVLLALAVLLGTEAYVPSSHRRPADVKKPALDVGKAATTAFAALTLGAGLLSTPLIADASVNFPATFSSSTVVSEKVTREGLYGSYEVDLVQEVDDARSTFKEAKETKTKKGKYTAILAILIVGSFIVPMAQYFWYVRDDDSSDKFFAEDVPEPPKKKGWF